MSYVNLVRRAVRKTLGGRADQTRNENGQFADEGGEIKKEKVDPGIRKANEQLAATYKPKTIDNMKRILAGAQANEAVVNGDLDRDMATYEAEKIYSGKYYRKIKPADLLDEFNYTFGITAGASDNEMQGYLTKLEQDYGW